MEHLQRFSQLQAKKQCRMDIIGSINTRCRLIGGGCPAPAMASITVFFSKQNSEHMSLNENENLYIGYLTYL
jgi:hypothetical protein